MEQSDLKPNIPPQRLCSEIQLFDLCDLETCDYKSDRYCSNTDLLSSFEKIAEDEIRPPQMYIDEEHDFDDETEESDFDEDEYFDDEEWEEQDE